MLAALQMPGRTADGVAFVVTPDTTATVTPYCARQVEIPELSLSDGISLSDLPVMGGVATDVNGSIGIALHTESKADLNGWFPPDFTLYQDLLSLLRVYLGWRYDAHISLTFPRRLLPAPCLSSRGAYLGYSCLLGHDPDDLTPDPTMPETLHLDFTARDELNPDDDGTALATDVWVCQLKDRKAFDKADYPTLLSDASNVLKADLLAEKDAWICPGSSVSVDMPMDENAQFVAIVAQFRDPDTQKDNWRVVLTRDELDPDAPRELVLEGATLTLSKKAEK